MIRFPLRAFALAIPLAVAPAEAQSPDFTVFLNVRPDPSPYVADWESDPSIVTLVLSYTGAGGVAFYLDGRVMRGTESVVAGRSTAFEFVRASQLVLTTRDGIWEANSVTYQASLRDLLEQTGRLPDGEYQFCVDVRQGLPEAGPGALLAADCAPFSITAPQPPGLVTPGDGETVIQPFPTFVWTPVLLGANARVGYHVRVAPVLPGQSPLDAINNVPMFEGDFPNAVTLYPRDALPLEEGERYVWQVQATDDAGLPVGERQGKSEVWTFTYTPTGVEPPVAFDPDTADRKPAVGTFQWGETTVEVTSVTDSSYDRYAGTGRFIIIKDIFEPEVPFDSVRLTTDGARVRAAPADTILFFAADSVTPTGDTIQLDASPGLTWPLDAIGLPFRIFPSGITLFADSASGEQWVGVSGAGRLTLTDEDMEFSFTDLRVGPRGPEGTLRLAKEFSVGSDIWSAWGGQDIVRIFKDSTILRIANGVGTLELTGQVRIPAKSGLRTDVYAAWDSAYVAAEADPDDDIDPPPEPMESKDVLLWITKAVLGSDGEFYLAASDTSARQVNDEDVDEGRPQIRLGKTGVKVALGTAYVDLSDRISPPGKPNGWQGIYFDTLTLELPKEWQNVQGADPIRLTAQGLALDETGLSGDLAVSNLWGLGTIVFEGFRGRLDSLRFTMVSGTLERGYVEGAIGTPFLGENMPYRVAFSPVGIEEAYIALDRVQVVTIPSLKATATIQRASISYERPVGTLTMDAQVTIDQDGIALDKVQVYDLAVSSDGNVTLGSGWLVFDQADDAGFKGFPVALDSIGMGSGTSGDEVWLGVAGRFNLNETLPAAAGVFRLFAVRDGPGEAWRFDRIAVDAMAVSYENAAFAFSGSLAYMDNDSVYGSGFKAGVRLQLQDLFGVSGNLIVGATTFRYWYVDARLILPPPGIQLGPLPLAIWGFAGGAYSRMRAEVDSVTLVTTYVPDASVAVGLKAAVSIGSSGNQGFIWNSDTWLEAAFTESGGLQSMILEGDHWMLTEVSRRDEKLWGKVRVDLPVSEPVLHANLIVNIGLEPMITARNAWAELHFEEDDWYVHVGLPQRQDSVILYPGVLDLPATAYVQIDPEGVGAGFTTFLEKEKTVGKFKGSVSAHFAADARLRYRPFRATGEGELWGDFEAKVKYSGTWYEILSGTMRATMNFEFPDPTRVWGRIRVRYRVAGGLARGTFRMRYRWGGSGDDDSSEEDQFVMIAATSPLPNDTGASVTGVTYYLGMSEGVEYGTDDGVYRMRLSGTPTIGKRTLTNEITRLRSGQSLRTVETFPSIGTVQRVWDDERATLTLVGPGYAPLDPATTYRSTVTFVLEKQSGSGAWEVQQTVTNTLTFTTSGAAPILAQFVSESDPRGMASRLYYGGPNAGVFRLRFTNVHPDLTSGAAVGRLVANGSDTVAGSWGAATYPFAARQLAGDPTLYRFAPGGALAPSTTYRFALVRNDSTAEEHYAVSFATSAYASLAAHVAASTVTVEADRGPGPVSATGTYLLGVNVILAGSEPMVWDDIDSIEVTGVGAGWEVIPRTRCQWVGGKAPTAMSLGMTAATLCGATPMYENVLAVGFTAASDTELPASSTATITIRLNHRREGWNTFTFAVPPAPSLADVISDLPTIGNPPPPPPPPGQGIDITPPSRGPVRGR